VPSGGSLALVRGAYSTSFGRTDVERPRLAFERGVGDEVHAVANHIASEAMRDATELANRLIDAACKLIDEQGAEWDHGLFRVMNLLRDELDVFGGVTSSAARRPANGIHEIPDDAEGDPNADFFRRKAIADSSI
jgi:hypothetical protein